MTYRLVYCCPYLEGTTVLQNVGNYTIFHSVQRNMAANLNLQRHYCVNHISQNIYRVLNVFLSDSVFGFL